MADIIYEVKKNLGRAALLLGVALACRSGDTTGPSPTAPYIGIVVKVDAPPGVPTGGVYEYHIRELSGTLNIDTVVTGRPSDTVYVAVPPATYTVSVAGVPRQCSIREGPDRAVYVPEKSNTTAVWYIISCRPQLLLTTASEGQFADSQFIFGISYGGRTQRVGLLGAHDTAVVDSLPEGEALVELADVAGNCVVTSDGGTQRMVHVDSVGGLTLNYHIVCSDEPARPKIIDFIPTYHDGAGGVLFRATDPNHDIASYTWDITDCHRLSVLRNGARERSGVYGGRTGGQDTVTIIAAFEIGTPDAGMQDRCATLRVTDYYGNTTAVLEKPLLVGGSPGPTPIIFNARFNGTSLVQTQLLFADPAQVLGTFAAYRLRDGTFGTGDGQDDIAIYTTTGFLGSNVPDLGIGTAPLLYDNFISAIVYLFDLAGRFTRLEDADLFR